LTEMGATSSLISAVTTNAPRSPKVTTTVRTPRARSACAARSPSSSVRTARPVSVSVSCSLGMQM
jgi:hypothetical protein